MGRGNIRAQQARWSTGAILGLTLALMPALAHGSPPAEGPSPAPPVVVATPSEDPDPASEDAQDPREAKAKAKRFMIGLEAVAVQTPPLHTQVIRFDRRYIGQNTTLGGAGIFGRWRANDRIALDLGVRSGSLRVQRESDDLVAQDLLIAEIGSLLYLAHGEIGHLAIDWGLGGLGHQIRYSRSDGLEGTQRVGALLFRVGADVEILLKRLAFVISLRAYGVITHRKRTRSRGAIFEGVDPADRLAPVPVFQTNMIGSAGVAYRF